MCHAECAVVANPTMMFSFNFGTDYLAQFIESRSNGFISYLPTNDNVGKDGYGLNRDWGHGKGINGRGEYRVIGIEQVVVRHGSSGCGYIGSRVKGGKEDITSR